MRPINALAAQAVENPETLAMLGEAEIRGVMGTLTMVAAAAHAKWLAVLEAERAAKQTADGDKLLHTAEIAERLGCCVATVIRGWKADKYPFMFKHGKRLVGSADGLERWIKARTATKRSA